LPARLLFLTHLLHASSLFARRIAATHKQRKPSATASR